MQQLTNEQAERVSSKVNDLKPRGWWKPEHEESWRQWAREQVLVEDMPDLERGYYTGLVDAICWANGEKRDGFSEFPMDGHMGDVLRLKFDLEKLIAVFHDIDDEGRIFTLGYRTPVGKYGRSFYLALWCSEAEGSDSEEVEGDPRFQYTVEQIIEAFEAVNEEWLTR